MQTASEILKRKGPQFNKIDCNVTVREAITVMKTSNISYIIVFDGSEYAGIFSERDYAQKIDLLDKDADKTKLKDVLTKDLPVITGNESSTDCMKMMNAHQTRYLPVFEDFEFKGIITIHI